MTSKVRRTRSTCAVALARIRAVLAEAQSSGLAPVAPFTNLKTLLQAQAEGLTLVVAGKTGYFGVTLDKPDQPKPYKARVSRGGKQVSLGYFATAEEAALCVARTPEGKAAAAAMRARSLTSEGQVSEKRKKAKLHRASHKAMIRRGVLARGVARQGPPINHFVDNRDQVYSAATSTWIEDLLAKRQRSTPMCRYRVRSLSRRRCG